nr:MAG TPA: tail collar fiber protein [Caudoviricetes sp.]
MGNVINMIGGGAGGEGISTSICTNITAVSGNGKCSLTWTDPPATETSHGVDIKWKSTIVRYKAGSAPTSATDGTVAVIETTHNQYQSNPLVITGLTNGVAYYISVFPKAENGAINTEATQIVQCTPMDFPIWTVKIDQSNSNPLTCCTYADSAVGMDKASSEWDAIFGYKPCIMQNGNIVGYLNPNDFSKYEDGSTAPITDNNYDVMIEFPRRGLNISTSGDIVTVSLTTNPNGSNFQYLAHKRGNIQKDYFYLGAYVMTNEYKSVSGQSPLVNVNLTNFINNTHIRGAGYEIMAFYQYTYIQALYVLKYGNLNSQQALGQGYVGGSSAQTTGATNTKGMCYGSSSTTDRVKLFGLEDFWGNVSQWLSGLYSDSSRNLLTTTDNFGTSTTASAWEYNVASGASSNISGWVSKVQGGNNSGFVVKEVSGSATTFFCDDGTLYASDFPIVGGYWLAGGIAGVFNCRVPYAASNVTPGIGARLMYL